jgi:hypothetical protein
MVTPQPKYYIAAPDGPSAFGMWTFGNVSALTVALSPMIPFSRK